MCAHVSRYLRRPTEVSALVLFTSKGMRLFWSWISVTRSQETQNKVTPGSALTHRSSFPEFYSNKDSYKSRHLKYTGGVYSRVLCNKMGWCLLWA